jgi:hypothetical protein
MDDDDSDGRASQAKKGKYKTCIRARASSQRDGEYAGEQKKKGERNPEDRRKERLQQASQLHKSRDLTTHISQKEKGHTKKKHTDCPSGSTPLNCQQQQHSGAMESETKPPYRIRAGKSKQPRVSSC